MYWLCDPVTFGLLLDIVGAFMIAWPDIPRLSQHLRSGRLRRGKHRIESNFPLAEGMTGHKEIVEEIEYYHQRAKEDPDYEFENLDYSTPLTVNKDKIVTPPMGDDRTQLEIGEFPYSGLEPIIQNKIRKQETRVRTVGFLCLATGFLLQLIGQLV